jgi:hypothetical protein
MALEDAQQIFVRSCVEKARPAEFDVFLDYTTSYGMMFLEAMCRAF